MEKQTKKVLFLPFLQIPSGHHQVASALMDGITDRIPHILCEKVDILSYSYGKIESLVSAVYLKWIHRFPQLYNFIYKISVFKNIEESKRYLLYELLFLFFIKRLIQEKKPDLIICTHALPAYMVNCLKKKKLLEVPVINVYTDFFIHRFWGIEHIDYHFIPTKSWRSFLNKKGIPNERIFNTSIPIHSKIKKVEKFPTHSNKPLSILISGGNMGAGSLEELIEKLKKTQHKYHLLFYVLCGKNTKLYEKLAVQKLHNIIPLPYIDCRQKMNKLYESIDAVLTKPGGVTISECLFKRKPIMVYDALPGQEQINLNQLKELGLVFHLNKDKIPESIYSILQDQHAIEQFHDHLSDFHDNLDPGEPADLIVKLLGEKD
ncbi:MGDG synthase family glycosyltransferase [Bacillus dakarensis]|uniref:MGDG synthase family glycosyltransferase n=1 Tax=Robertmurraya dakarensis TaxID=1926278 RepID=UPI000981E7AF|nr:glycosyltransferase [Bacillus dakarensis]